MRSILTLRADSNSTICSSGSWRATFANTLPAIIVKALWHEYREAALDLRPRIIGTGFITSMRGVRFSYGACRSRRECLVTRVSAAKWLAPHRGLCPRPAVTPTAPGRADHAHLGWQAPTGATS